MPDDASPVTRPDLICRAEVRVPTPDFDADMRVLHRRTRIPARPDLARRRARRRGALRTRDVDPSRAERRARSGGATALRRRSGRVRGRRGPTDRSRRPPDHRGGCGPAAGHSGGGPRARGAAARGQRCVGHRAGRHALPGPPPGSARRRHHRVAHQDRRCGSVDDMVHYHTVGFQLIFCHRGWVRLVYEDQGPPFVLGAGDCVIQPPEIRHRVLESSAGFEVIEIGVPAEHLTTIDHEMELPTPHFRPDREFQGTKFVLHREAEAVWGPWRIPGFEARETGIGEATKGVAGVQVGAADSGDGGPGDPARHGHPVRVSTRRVRNASCGRNCRPRANRWRRFGSTARPDRELRRSLRRLGDPRGSASRSVLDNCAVAPRPSPSSSRVLRSVPSPAAVQSDRFYHSVPFNKNQHYVPRCHFRPVFSGQRR